MAFYFLTFATAAWGYVVLSLYRASNTLTDRPLLATHFSPGWQRFSEKSRKPVHFSLVLLSPSFVSHPQMRCHLRCMVDTSNTHQMSGMRLYLSAHGGPPIALRTQLGSLLLLHSQEAVLWLY
ncbi:hypothetical protein ASPVEDRAFT_460064 [Aspergillus versicolor CBS 583.65]|uniref:Uncharacterized protein n=1 Tax=Aspergillus versicolor CBS 583.65 TaxID=1036611 RepID=A0A1L9PAF4_ASPVE|nr:uncharacterized protein ASPVEDRAFT_460064 [Aspergillus versicolor CBS 583.65]OJI98455.1 hypothetical protein ASPVEDRAFT_460064 [Aspergillus versicolor CBS 583.65]